MSRIRSKFEVELKAKIAQKTPGNLSEETYLLKTFKFFDLDNSKTISKQEWIRAIGKIGVVVEDPHQLDNLFEIYDESKDGFLDYREFVASIYSSDSSIGKQIYPQILSRASELQRAEELFEVIRETLKARGARGLIGLARQFKIMDDIDSGTLEFDEFVKCFRVYRLQVSEDDAQLLFNYIARENNDYIYYNEFLNALTGQIHPFRKSLIANAFRQLELDGNGSINIEKVRKSYDPRSHPDVSNGKQTEEEVLNEFLETFEMHHSLYGGRDGTINYHEFEDYYKSISANIDNDHYFEAMMKSS